jgi:hypothetical protein
VARNVAWWKKAFFVPIQYLFFRSVNVGARTQVLCASSPDAMVCLNLFFICDDYYT